MNIFLCDIGGTFDSSINTNRNSEIIAFLKNLKDLITYDNLDNFSFSFITEGNIDYLKPYYEELKSALNNRITLGPQFSFDRIMLNNKEISVQTKSKLDHIINILNKKNVKTIYYADDSSLNHEIITSIITNHYPNIELINFQPSCTKNNENFYCSLKKGLPGLNESINNYLNKKQVKTMKYRN